MDAVVIWNDIEEKEYRREKIRYLRDNLAVSTDTEGIPGKKDFLLTLAGIARNMTDLGRIHIISVFPPEWSRQFMESLFPGGSGILRFVDFNEVFSGLEGFLPSFSCIAASTLLYRLHSLDDRLVLFHPGCIPLQPFNSSMLTKDGSPIHYGKVVRSDALTGEIRKIFIPGMMPVVLSRKDIEKCLTENPGMLSTNIRHRFDSPRSRKRPDGQVRIDMLMANREGAVTMPEGPVFHWPGIRRRAHGTMIQSLHPGSNADLVREFIRVRQAYFLSLAPLESFPRSQRQAILDFLCVHLKIRLP